MFWAENYWKLQRTNLYNFFLPTNFNIKYQKKNIFMSLRCVLYIRLSLKYFHSYYD